MYQLRIGALSELNRGRWCNICDWKCSTFGVGGVWMSCLERLNDGLNGGVSKGHEKWGYRYRWDIGRGVNTHWGMGEGRGLPGNCYGLFVKTLYCGEYPSNT